MSQVWTRLNPQSPLVSRPKYLLLPYLILWQIAHRPKGKVTGSVVRVFWIKDTPRKRDSDRSIILDQNSIGDEFWHFSSLFQALGSWGRAKTSEKKKRGKTKTRSGALVLPYFSLALPFSLPTTESLEQASISPTTITFFPFLVSSYKTFRTR